MDDRQRARELLAQEWRKLGEDGAAGMLVAGCELPPLAAASIAAITAALRAAPEGFVIVPVEATVEMVGAGGRAQGETLTWGAVRACWRAMLAARPQGVKDATEPAGLPQITPPIAPGEVQP